MRREVRAARPTEEAGRFPLVHAEPRGGINALLRHPTWVHTA
ncbi:hypothetical protein SALCHL_002938 [Streptomyces albus subsp. chlorinus]|nr:hypothetical protein [Streptomyces albus]